MNDLHVTIFKNRDLAKTLNGATTLSVIPLGKKKSNKNHCYKTEAENPNNLLPK